MGAWLNLSFAATDTLPRSLASILLPIKSELSQSVISDVFDIYDFRSAASKLIPTTANDSKEREQLLMTPYLLTVLKNGLKCFEF